MFRLSSIIIGFLIWGLCVNAHGQSYRRMDNFVADSKVFGSNNISLSLIPLVQSGFEVSYDRKIVNKHWIKITPTFYYSQDFTQSAPDDIKHLNSFGFKLHHKYFPYNNTVSKLGIFIDYGPNFSRFDITTKADQRAQFDKYGVDCLIGFQKLLANVFFLEFYGGLSTNLLKSRNEESDNTWRDVLENRSDMWFDYGVTGNYFIVGINLGVLF